MAEQYSIQAETLMKSAIEDYIEIIKEIQASNANMTVIKGIRVNISGKPRRLVDIGDLRTGETDNKLQVLVFNTDHIEILVDQINEAGFETNVDGQFVNIDVPDPTFKQLMEVVDDLNRRKNSAIGRLTKAKSEATTRARAAVENEFIDLAIARQTSNRCQELFENNEIKIKKLTLDKVKSILGHENFKKYKYSVHSRWRY